MSELERTHQELYQRCRVCERVLFDSELATKTGLCATCREPAMTTELHDTLAQILVQAIGDEYAKVVDPKRAARCWEDHGPALSVKVQAGLDAAGYAVVRKDRMKELTEQRDWLEHNSVLRAPGQETIADYLKIRDEWETPCPVREDKIHCVHWYDGEACCDCGDPATGRE